MRGRVLTAGTLASAAIAVHRTRCSSALSSQAESGHERRVPRTIWEQLTKPPRFDAKSPSRFDLDSYAGRSLHFLDALGDITTLVISGEKLREQQKLLESHAAGEATGATDAELWHARKLCASSIHPETGKEIPAAFRFTAFAPANIFISLGLIRPEASLMSSAFFQWLNQTYNAGVNWHNRGGGEEASMEKLGLSYVAATGAALAIGVGAMPLLGRLGISGRLVQVTVPATAVSVSSVVNLVLTRWDELVGGVAVYTEDGHPLGVSKAAGQMALGQCSAARVLWSFVVLTAAPLINRGILAAVPSIATSTSASMTMQASVVFVSLWLSVPLCMAIWPQRASASVDSLEPELRQAKHPLTGEPVQRAFFNKGL